MFVDLSIISLNKNKVKDNQKFFMKILNTKLFAVLSLISSSERRNVRFLLKHSIEIQQHL